MADLDYNVPVVMEQGGATQRVKSGGRVAYDSGGVAEMSEAVSAAVEVASDGIIEVDIPNAAGTIAIVLAAPYKMRLWDAMFVKDSASAGGAGDLVDIKNGATAITSQIVANIAAKTIARVTTIDGAQQDLAVGATLNVVVAKATNPSGRLYLSFIRVP